MPCVLNPQGPIVALHSVYEIVVFDNTLGSVETRVIPLHGMDISIGETFLSHIGKEKGFRLYKWQQQLECCLFKYNPDKDDPNKWVVRETKLPLDGLWWRMKDCPTLLFDELSGRLVGIMQPESPDGRGTHVWVSDAI